MPGFKAVVRDDGELDQNRPNRLRGLVFVVAAVHGRSLTDSRQQFIGMCINRHLYLALGRAYVAVACPEMVETWKNLLSR